jgi:hypothetical protein
MPRALLSARETEEAAMSARHRLHDFYDSFEESDENASSIRPRSLVPPTILMGGGDGSPCCVYAMCQDDKKYYLGTLFDHGLIPAEGWDAAMRRDRVGESEIASVEDWVRARSI